MNTTAKAVTFIVAIGALVAIMSTSLTQASLQGGGTPPGFCDNIVDCIIGDPFVQDAIEFATHERYTDAEAVAAMGPEEDDNPLNHERYTDDEARFAMGAEEDDNALNHDRYTDAEAVAAVGRVGMPGFPAPDYDSGFFEMKKNGDVTLGHLLGGDPLNYFVHLDFRTAISGPSDSNPAGVFYHVGETVITISNPDDEAKPIVRARIWVAEN